MQVYPALAQATDACRPAAQAPHQPQTIRPRVAQAEEYEALQQWPAPPPQEGAQLPPLPETVPGRG